MSLGRLTTVVGPLSRLLPQRLSWQLLAVICLVALLLGLSFTFIRLKIQQHTEINEAVERSRQVIEIIRQHLTHPLELESKEQVGAVVDQHESLPGVMSVMVFGPDARLIADHAHMDPTTNEQIPSINTIKSLLPTVLERHQPAKQFVRHSQGHALLSIHPLLDHSRQPARANGALAVTIEVPSICQPEWSELLVIYATVIVESLLLVLMLWLVLRWLVATPLQQLHDAAQRTTSTAPFQPPTLTICNEFMNLANEFAKAFEELDHSRANIQKLAIVAQQTDNMVVITDAQGRTEWVNDSFTRLTGYTLDEMRGQYPGTLLSGPKTDPTVIRMIDDRVNSGRCCEAELINYTKSGAEYWVNMNIKPVCDANGVVQHFVAIQRDVTKQRLAEEALHRNVERYRGLIESQLDLILRLDPRGRITFANKAFGVAMGQDCEQLLDRELMCMISTSMQEQTRKALEYVKSPPHRVSFENLLCSVQGERWICWETCAVLDDTGNLQEIQAVGRDVTALKETQRNVEQFAEDLWATRTKLELQTLELAAKARELEAARAAAESASQSKSAFLANMSHEIRTPMTAVLGYSELLLDPQQTADERFNCVRIIRRNGEHLLSLINDILDVSKIEAGKMVIEEVPTSIQQLVADVESLMRARAQDKGLTFETRLLTPLPQTIMTDPTRVRQILVNLVGNAIKFTQNGFVRLHVSLHTPKTDERDVIIHFHVSDSGIGISAAQQILLFQPFSQADSSTTRKFGGTGLGLTISQRLAQMLGGEITLRSKPGQGSTFTVTIRARLADQTTRGASDNSSAAAGWIDNTGQIPPVNVPTLHGSRILLAEDGEDNRALLSLFLTRAGATVQSVSTGKSAVDLAMLHHERSEPFDLILMDMQMPELDGYSATTMLRSRGYRGKIVALTAHALATDRLRCLSIGCDDFISKPVQRDRLIALVGAHLHQTHPQAPTANTDPKPLSEPAPTSTSQGVDHVNASTNAALDEQPDAEFASIVAQFTQILPQRAGEIADMLQRQDLEALARLAHQLKGAAGGFGFPQITHQAALIEEAAIEHDMDGLMGSIKELQKLCRDAATPAPDDVSMT